MTAELAQMVFIITICYYAAITALFWLVYRWR